MDQFLEVCGGDSTAYYGRGLTWCLDENGAGWAQHKTDPWSSGNNIIHLKFS
jgi:hypothetical protein